MSKRQKGSKSKSKSKYRKPQIAPKGTRLKLRRIGVERISEALQIRLLAGGVITGRDIELLKLSTKTRNYESHQWRTLSKTDMYTLYEQSVTPENFWPGFTDLQIKQDVANTLTKHWKRIHQRVVRHWQEAYMTEIMHTLLTLLWNGELPNVTVEEQDEILATITFKQQRDGAAVKSEGFSKVFAEIFASPLVDLILSLRWDTVEYLASPFTYCPNWEIAWKCFAKRNITNIKTRLSEFVTLSRLESKTKSKTQSQSDSQESDSKSGKKSGKKRKGGPVDIGKTKARKAKITLEKFLPDSQCGKTELMWRTCFRELMPPKLLLSLPNLDLVLDYIEWRDIRKDTDPSPNLNVEDPKYMPHPDNAYLFYRMVYPDKRDDQQLSDDEEVQASDASGEIGHRLTLDVASCLERLGKYMIYLEEREAEKEQTRGHLKIFHTQNKVSSAFVPFSAFGHAVTQSQSQRRLKDFLDSLC